MQQLHGFDELRNNQGIIRSASKSQSSGSLSPQTSVGYFYHLHSFQVCFDTILRSGNRKTKKMSNKNRHSKATCKIIFLPKFYFAPAPEAAWLSQSAMLSAKSNGSGIRCSSFVPSERFCCLQFALVF
jgi:hypothetical protein